MWWNTLYLRWSGNSATRRRFRPKAARPPRPRLFLEHLEDRTVPSSFNAATVSDLIADIHVANQQGGSNTITLVAPATSPYALTAVDNTTDGGNGLPVIAANDRLTIVGNGDTIQGSNGFRLFDVAAGASLTLKNLTLLNGSAGGWGGGAIHTQGALVLNGVTVENNSSTIGGGLYVGSGTASINNSLLQGNSAERGGGLYVAGGTVSLHNDTLSANSCVGYGPAGDGVGGGVAVFGGTVTMTNVTLSANTAVSGAGLAGRAGTYTQPNGSNGGPGASAYGGGIAVFGGTVTLNNDTVTGNLAQGGRGGNGGDAYQYSFYASPGNGGNGGSAYGGGVYLGPHATVTLANDTISSNTAQGGAGGAAGEAARHYYSYGYYGYYGYGYYGYRGYYGYYGFHGYYGYYGGFRPPIVYDVYGSPGTPGLSEGGGLYIDALASVSLDAVTLAQTTNNAPDQIFGSYTRRP
jgi:hypothetical protein